MAKILKNKNNRSVIVIAVIVLSVGIVLGLKFIYKPVKPSSLKQGEHQKRVKGNPEGALKIIEYIDFQCPSCAQGAKTLSYYLENHPDDIFVEMKYFPLDGHAHGLKAAIYTECAAQQGAFWPFHDLILERQEQWRNLPDVDSVFQGMIKEIGLKTEKFNACIKDEKIVEVVKRDKDIGAAMGVQSTPTYFINEEMIVGTKELRAKIVRHFGEIPPETSTTQMQMSPVGQGQ